MPYTGLVLFFLSIHLGAFLIFLAHWVASAGLLPGAVERVSKVYEERPVRATLVGIFTFAPLLAVALNIAKVGGGGAVLGLLGTFGLLVVAFVGTAGLARLIGFNLARESSGWSQSLRGGVMLALVFITPFLGWFLMLPVGLASGFGAVILAKPWRARKSVAAVEESELGALS